MESPEVSSIKWIKVMLWVVAILFSILVFRLADLMSVMPSFLNAKIAHAPTQSWADIQSLLKAMK